MQVGPVSSSSGRLGGNHSGPDDALRGLLEKQTNAPLNRKLRMGMIGGGIGSFIGRTHVLAASLDNLSILVAGAFSRSRERSELSGQSFLLDPSRVYGDWREFLEKEATRPESERLDFVVIATTNESHCEIALGSLEAGFDVVCDKPLAVSSQEAELIADAVERTGQVFCLTHNYTGYPLVRQARSMIAAGELGSIRTVRVQYIQGWLAEPLEHRGVPQAEWRMDPHRNGVAGCFADIGSHAFNLFRYITDLVPTRLSANLRRLVPGRQLDDYGVVTLELPDGGLMTLVASQVSVGYENELRIEVDGTAGSLRWTQNEPNQMQISRNDAAHQIYTRNPNADYAHAALRESCRSVAGLPEAFNEAFANVYRSAFADMVRRREGLAFGGPSTEYPNVYDGVEEMRFIEAVVRSSADDARWVRIPQERTRK